MKTHLFRLTLQPLQGYFSHFATPGLPETSDKIAQFMPQRAISSGNIVPGCRAN